MNYWDPNQNRNQDAGWGNDPRYQPIQMFAHDNVPQSNGKATASLILGIVSIVAGSIVAAIIGLILGIKARNEAHLAGVQPSGKAMAGIICSVIGIVVSVIMIVITFLALPEMMAELGAFY